ncbi:hypothetical protein A2Z23_02180 [Candidatus Curtissbacteria bacterium RBG_16_39_7]|uniref:Uncharacterized protein n=1 Tax=Candidatus Curtissbacteria bacterium RBG_16_39_7 TaxID=1797707 RepID=A0A1F5G458_9BACT|nr:MAG: hypothetical protein A2Z23_02180 [Candidatus Curtissbacteria bacterium RBG_16_39_7]
MVLLTVIFFEGWCGINVKEQVDKFLQSKNASIIACGTCMNIRNQKDSKECPAGGIEDLYHLITESDKVVTF